MKDGENENLSSFWIDRDDVNRCEDDLMVTKSLAIKAGKILNSSCKEKFEGYKCWREYKGLLLNEKENGIITQDLFKNASCREIMVITTQNFVYDISNHTTRWRNFLRIVGLFKID